MTFKIPIANIKRISNYLIYFGLMSALVGNTTSEDLNGKYCNPDCSDPISHLTFNSNMTFSFSTMLFGGMSRSGNWELTKENNIKINTLEIFSPKKAYQIPPPQIISILSNGKLKFGNTLYTKE